MANTYKNIMSEDSLNGYGTFHLVLKTNNCCL